jgi:uncharacterized protein
MGAAESARLLRSLFDRLPAAERDLEAAHEHERRGDELLRELIAHMGGTFLGPFDSEDIARLGRLIADVTDEVHHAAQMVLLTGLRESPDELTDLCDVLVSITGAASTLLDQLSSRLRPQRDLVTIDLLESKADALYRSVLLRIFAGEFDDLDAIRLKEVADAIERSINAVEDIADEVRADLRASELIVYRRRC